MGMLKLLVRLFAAAVAATVAVSSLENLESSPLLLIDIVDRAFRLSFLPTGEVPGLSVKGGTVADKVLVLVLLSHSPITDSWS